MQNVTLPDEKEYQAALLARPVLMLQETAALVHAINQIGKLEALIAALYAKQGEDCPLFKEEG